MGYHFAEILKNKIDYKEDNINTITLIKDNNSMLLLFALKKNQQVPQHFSPVNAMAYVLEGEIEIKFKNDKCLIKKDEYIELGANENHSVVAIENSKFIVARI